ncbi:hypothetical protein B0H16DRAFT_1464090 [Mycena metata]|uniref:Uncharacterized protein n=1 Tax=Mycena metata TaxID=1033252 RepID=A0AAD7IHA1_9AGAR|nr:hypothetical protein B0H16DRAFT_1464090 [Mycena metata]
MNNAPLPLSLPLPPPSIAIIPSQQPESVGELSDKLVFRDGKDLSSALSSAPESGKGGRVGGRKVRISKAAVENFVFLHTQRHWRDATPVTCWKKLGEGGASLPRQSSISHGDQNFFDLSSTINFSTGIAPPPNINGAIFRQTETAFKGSFTFQTPGCHINSSDRSGPSERFTSGLGENLNGENASKIVPVRWRWPVGCTVKDATVPFVLDPLIHLDCSKPGSTRWLEVKSVKSTSAGDGQSTALFSTVDFTPDAAVLHLLNFYFFRLLGFHPRPDTAERVVRSRLDLYLRKVAVNSEIDMPGSVQDTYSKHLEKYYLISRRIPHAVHVSIQFHLCAQEASWQFPS